MKATLVGLGSWGQVLGRAVQGKSERIKFVSGVTRTLARAEAFAAEMNIPLSDDYTAALADPGIDAVVLATPHSQHVDQIIAAAEAGKHVFVEKPVAMDRVGAQRAFAACRKAGVVLAVGQNRRFLPAYVQTRNTLVSGELGRILHIEANFSGPSGYRRPAQSWRLERAESPAGGMTGKGIHMTDLMIDLLGAHETVQVHSTRQIVQADTDDKTLVLIGFADGVTGHLTTLTTTPDIWRFQVFCSEGWIEIRDQHTVTSRRLDGATELREFEKIDTELAELEAFAATVTDGAAYPVTAEQAIANVALFEQIAAQSDKLR